MVLPHSSPGSPHTGEQKQRGTTCGPLPLPGSVQESTDYPFTHGGRGVSQEHRWVKPQSKENPVVCSALPCPVSTLSARSRPSQFCSLTLVHFPSLNPDVPYTGKPGPPSLSYLKVPICVSTQLSLFKIKNLGLKK